MKTFGVKYLVVLMFVLFSLCAKTTRATHIVGSELYYTQLDNLGNYEITLKLYRDCFNGSTTALNMDTISYLFIFNHSDNSIYSVQSVSKSSLVTLNSSYNNPCLIEPDNVCVEEAVFKYRVNLPATPAGYDLVYQRCCRNGTIANIISPGDVGSTTLIHIPGSSEFSYNSSPSYKNFPPIFLCTNIPLVFDNSATDPDGDIIRYELCNAYQGADANCPRPTDVNCNTPYPPFYDVPYSSGFSGGYPITATPAFSIDSLTGKLTGTPSQTGQYVIAVCAKEYRNGQLICINKREFQFNVVNCGMPIAAFPSQINLCSGMDIQFNQTSFNATNFYWDFGDGTTTTSPSPLHTYTDTGVYQVSLVVSNNNPGCADTVIQPVSAYPKLVPTFTVPPPACLDDHSFNFTAGGVFDNTATFSWNFGNDANQPVSSLQNPTNINFNVPGVKNVSLTVTQYICAKTLSQNVTIHPEPRPLLTPPASQCLGDSIPVGLNYAIADIANSQINPGAINASYVNNGNGNYTFIYQDTGQYTISVIASTSKGCRDTTNLPVKVYPPFNPTFSVPGDQCLQGNNFSFSAQNFGSGNPTFTWTFDNAASQTQATGNSVYNIQFNQDGFHQISVLSNSLTCSDLDTFSVYVIPEPLAAIAPQDQFCEGNTYNFTNQSIISNAYNWNFGDGSTLADTSTLLNPSYTYPGPGTYTVSLTATNQAICKDTAYFTVFIKPLLKPYFDPPGGQCLDNNLFNLAAGGTFTNGAQFGWGIPDVANIDTSTIQNVNGITFNQSGSFPITLYISEYGCLKTYTDTAFVAEPPAAYFTTPPDTGCSPVTIQFADSSSSNLNYTCYWDFGDGQTSTLYSPSHTYVNEGVYDVTLIITNTEVCSKPDTFKLSNLITVYGLPTAGVSVDSSTRSVLDPYITFTDLSQGAQYCTLYFGDNSTSDLCNITHTYKDTGWYNYTQVVTNDLGCSDTIKGKIYIRPEFQFYVPNTFTPNKDGLNDSFKPSIVGVKNYTFRVFDRWGLELFNTAEPKEGWDGTYKGKPAPIDIYVYSVEFTTVFNKKETVYGRFNLLR